MKPEPIPHLALASLEVESTGEPGFKHEAVARALRTGIDRGLWATGQKIPSEHEIASHFQVAYMTARQAVSSLVQAGVLERIARKGTFVAPPREDASGDGHVYVLLRGAKVSLDPLYFPYIIDAFERELEHGGLEYTVYDYKVALRQHMLPPGSLVCCLLLTAGEAEIARQLAAEGHRVVTINRAEDQSDVPYVSPDNRAGSRTATEHLIELGHKRIAFVRGPRMNLDAIERRAGYRDAMAAAGLEPGPEEGEGFFEEAGYEATQRILRRGTPTAIVCASDVSAVGVITALQQAGLRVPDDVSIMGFGDFPIARFWQPNLSTVRLPLDDLGALAARAMVRLHLGETIGCEALAIPLVPRQSAVPCADAVERAAA